MLRQSVTLRSLPRAWWGGLGVADRALYPRRIANRLLPRRMAEIAAPDILLLTDRERNDLWRELIASIETYLAEVPSMRVAPVLDVERARRSAESINFDDPLSPVEALRRVVEALARDQVHTPHPRYFGLFNPAASTMGIAADALAAAYNCQLAAWSHSPFAVEVERRLIRFLGGVFGYGEAAADGTFTSGGAEANHTALIAALADRLPTFASGGIRSVDGDPVFYISSQSHHSFVKAARFCGLGESSMREVPVDRRFRMDVDRLRAMIARDREAGRLPFMVVATAGTTSGGVIDPLTAVADVAEAERLWYHVDAAWGGAAMLVPELRPYFAGIARSDSITLDAHKWLSVPMAAGILLTRRRDALATACGIHTDYMPKDAAGMNIVDPFTHSMQWSRRFIGLKLYLTLAVAGTRGYAETLRHQTAMGDLLRMRLRARGWRIVNETPLPVVCFTTSDETGQDAAFLQAIADQIVRSGEAWISTTRLEAHVPVLRACITSFRTSADDIDHLVGLLERSRCEIADSGP